MTEQSNKLMVGAGELADLAIEVWRLEKFLVNGKQGGLPPAVNHFLRRTRSFFERYEVEVIDLTGQPYEAGLAVEVAEVTDDKVGREIIVEMIAPIILSKGRIIRHGSAIISK